MTNKEIEAEVKRAFSGVTPDLFNAIQADCGRQKGEIIFMERKKTSKRWVRTIAGLAAAFLIVLGGTFGFFTYQTHFAVDSTISLDVNPSIELQVNQRERVLEVTPLNADGRNVLGDMDLKGSDLDVAVNALIGSMLRNGYLSDVANSILVSVDSGSPARGEEIQKRLAAEINALLQSDTFSGAVLSQTIQQNTDTKALAEQYGITMGKAQLIQQILDQSPQHTFADLASLSINELNLIVGDTSARIENLESVGTASDKGYIGDASAKEAALRHAGLAEASVSRWEWDMDYEHGMMVYEIDFYCDGYEYEYEINAMTGEVVACQKEAGEHHDEHHDEHHTTGSTDGQTGSTGTGETQISESAAKSAAFSHAGISQADAANVKCVLDRDDGKAVYEVEFDCGGYEYDYEIDAVTGAILQSSKEADDSYQAPPAETKPASTGAGETQIGEGAAKSAAFSHAGISQADAANVKCVLDRDDGKAVYEVEFDCGGYEYDYEVDAVTGAILQSSKEADDSYQAPPAETKPASTGTNGTQIGEGAAKRAAFSHAGVSQADAVNVKCVLDRDDGKTVYEVEFDCGGYEYDYEIDAATGAILQSSKEADDSYQAPPAETKPASTGAGGTRIGEGAAKSAAFSHAGVSQADATNVKCVLDRDDGKAVYEVEFNCGGCEYDYEIDAVTGEVITCQREDHEAHHDEHHAAGNTGTGETQIGEGAAKSAAFSHAGISQADAANVECVLDRDDGKAVYEVEFNCGGYEYSYEIDAATGAVLDYEIDR